jgi:hypothetical protein
MGTLKEARARISARKEEVRATKKEAPRSIKGALKVEKARGDVKSTGFLAKVAADKIKNKKTEAPTSPATKGAKPVNSEPRTAATTSKPTQAPTTPQPAKPAPASPVPAPTMQKKSVSKKTAYDIKQASNQKLTAGARKHYAMNAQASMKNKKKK